MTQTMTRKPRFYAANPFGLTDEQIQAECPAIFAETKHESRSEQFIYISTRDMLKFLRQNGLVPTYVRQSKSHIEGKTEFTKHLIRVRAADKLGKAQANTQEIGILNAHDGTCSYQLQEWIYRQVCTNGLIREEPGAHLLRVPHKGNRGDILGKVVEGTLTVLDNAQETATIIEEMQHIEVPREAQLLLSQAMMGTRFDLPEIPARAGEVPQYAPHPVYEPQDFLSRHRDEDLSNDLWTTMNVIQENMVKGGVRKYIGREKHTLRAVNSIDTLVEIDKKLWMFARHLQKVLG